MIRCVVAALLLLFFPLSVFASDVQCNEDFPNRCAVDLKLKEPAPFAGQLTSPELAIFLGQTANNCEKRIGIAVTATAAYHREDKSYALKLKDIDHKVDLQELEWYKSRMSPTTAAVLASIATAAVIFASILGVAKLGQLTQ